MSVNVACAITKRRFGFELTIKGALRSVHSLEVFLQVFAGQVRRQGDDFLDSYGSIYVSIYFACGEKEIEEESLTYWDPWYIRDRRLHRKRTKYPRTSM